MKGEGTNAKSPLGQVPPGWRLVRLKDVSTKIGSGATPKGGESVYLPTRLHFAFIRSQNVFDRHFEPAGLAFISDTHARELKNAEVQPFDILLNITGDGITFARACLAPSSLLPACVNQHVSIVRADGAAADPGYILSYLTHPAIKSYIESFNAGGSRRAITKGHIESFQVPLPPLAEQRSIARFLNGLDDKIDLNRRMNESLEAITRVIFKSWFVDFDPVHAKAEGCEPFGMRMAAAALFPDSFQESSSGKFPKGWTIGKVRDLVELSRETLNPSQFPEEVFDHYSIPAFDEQRWPIEEKGENIKSNKIVALPNMILLSKLNPRIPRVWMPQVSGVRRSIASTEFLAATPKPGISREFVYALFTSQSFLEVFTTLVTGTSGSHQRVKSEFLLEMDAIIPPTACMDSFVHIASPIYARVVHNLIQSRTLADIRDAFLPKLISGELRLKECKKALS